MSFWRELDDLRARVAALEAGATCPHIVSSDEGTSYCDLAQQTQDKLDRLIAQDRDDAPTRAGSLVERVAGAIHPNRCADPNLYLHEARAAIREVAAWLRVESEGRFGSGLHWSRRLEQEADR